MFVGALVGGFLGVAGAYLQGEVAGAYLQGEISFWYLYSYSYSGITSYPTFWAIVLDVALSGAIGGAVVHNVLEQQRAIRRARSSSNNNANNRSQDTDDPALQFIMRSMETSSRLSRRTTQAIVDGNGSSSSMMSSEYFLNTVGGGNGSENESTRAGVEEDIHSLPTVTVQDPDKLPEDCRRCAICLDAFLPGSFRKTLPCWHGFHGMCVDKWLRISGTCPICKHRIDG
jgi:hypothetical protein